METGYELLLPEGILTYFEVTHADRTSTAILIYLDEKDLSGEERSGKHLQSKGFYPPASIHDFPLRGKSLILHVRRRRWLDLDTGNPYMGGCSKRHSSDRRVCLFFKRHTWIIRPSVVAP